MRVNLAGQFVHRPCALCRSSLGPKAEACRNDSRCVEVHPFKYLVDGLLFRFVPIFQLIWRNFWQLNSATPATTKPTQMKVYFQAPKKIKCFKMARPSATRRDLSTV
jgi:hypothetical protein